MRTLTLIGFIGIGLSVALASACSTDGGETNDSTGTGTGTGAATSTSSGMGGSATSTSSAGGAGPSCPPPAPEHPGTEDTIGTVKGIIQDLEGKPAVEILTDVCGTNLCLSGESEPDGAFSITGTMGQILKDVALITANGINYVKMAGSLPNTPNHDFGLINTVKLPPFSEGTTFPASGDVTHNGVTFSIPDGANVKFDIIVYTEESQRGLRAVTFKPSDGNFPAIDPSLNLELMIGISPINTLICPGAKMTFDNSPGWDAGAEIEIFYNGYNTFKHWAPYGGWAKIADAVVSSDGKTVSTKDGQEIVELGTFGARKKP